MADAHHPIQLAARLSGLSPYVIRIWEHRYGAVEPRRTATNRRLYSSEDIERLRLLRDLTRGGHSISQVASLPNHKLRKLAAEMTGVRGGAAGLETPGQGEGSWLEECLAAARALDGRMFEDALKRAAAALGVHGVLHRLVAPLAQAVGDLWHEGRITAAHEHFASAMIRGFLANMAKPYGGSSGAPVLVVATPAGQLHELGALLVGAMAANLGWQVTYLGASLPAAEIAGAARQKRARVVALSLVYPEDDPGLPGELAALRESLPAEAALLAGGRAMPAYRDALENVGALPIENLAQLGSALDTLRTGRGAKPRRPVRGAKRPS